MSLNPKEVYARKILLKEHVNLGDLVSIDGSLIDATLSMRWADYREGAKKAKVNIGFNINQSIPSKIFLTNTTSIIRTLMNGKGYKQNRERGKGLMNTRKEPASRGLGNYR